MDGANGGGGDVLAAPAADAADGGAATKKKRRSGPRSRSSPYTGVTQYKRTGNWEAHIWVQNPRGKGHQRHLGSYLTAEDAARCYDRAVLRLRGEAAETNFPREEYAEDEFLLANERTERDRFLDLLRQRFALKSNAAQPPPGPTRSQPPRPKRKRSPGDAAGGSEEPHASPESPRYRTVVRAPRSSPMGMAPMAAASAAFAASSPHRVTVHQWPGGGHPLLGLHGGLTSPALTSPLPRPAPRHSGSPQGRGGGPGGGSGYRPASSFGAGGSGGGLLRHDSVGAASEEPLLITTTAPAASAQMQESLLWPSLPIYSAPTAGGGMPLPGPLSPLSSLPPLPSSLPPTPLLQLGQLSPPQPQLGSLLGGALGSAPSPQRPLGVLSTLSLPGSRAATPRASPSRFGSPPPAHLPAIPSFGDLAAQLAPTLRRTSSGGEAPAAPAAAAALGSLAGIQAQLSALETPGAPPVLPGTSPRDQAGTSAPMAAPAALASFNINLLSFPPLPLTGAGSGATQQERGALPAFAFPSFGQGSGITSSMLQAASAAAAAAGERAAGADPPATDAPGGSQAATPALSAGLASLLGGQGGASLGRWWPPASPARSEGQSQDWLAASLPMADLGAGSAFFNST